MMWIITSKDVASEGGVSYVVPTPKACVWGLLHGCPPVCLLSLGFPTFQASGWAIVFACLGGFLQDSNKPKLLEVSCSSTYIL